MKECVKCQRLRSEKYMQQAVFRAFLQDEPAGVWKCASSESCRKARKVCGHCGHLQRLHVNHEQWFGLRENVVACDFNMGMGDSCGCEK